MRMNASEKLVSVAYVRKERAQYALSDSVSVGEVSHTGCSCGPVRRVTWIEVDNIFFNRSCSLTIGHHLKPSLRGFLTLSLCFESSFNFQVQLVFHDYLKNILVKQN